MQLYKLSGIYTTDMKLETRSHTITCNIYTHVAVYIHTNIFQSIILLITQAIANYWDDYINSKTIK